MSIASGQVSQRNKPDSRRVDERRVSRGDVTGRLAGKVAIVTGVGAGQGREIALLFARAGAVLIGCDIEATGLEQTRACAAVEGLDLDLALVDASNFAAVGDWVAGGAARHGGIDILFNNAASAHAAPFEDMTLEQWHDTLRLELDVVFAPAKAVWPHMIARGSGSIINTAAMAGLLGCEVLDGIGQAAHAAGKGGVLSFTRQLAAEGARHWIRVNAITPGPILTEAVAARLAGAPDYARVFDGAPLLARPGRPLDVAYAGLFLASDESSFITGANLTVDGGTSCKIGASFR